MQKMVGQPFGLVLVPASEDIQNHVAEFRPSMEGYMRLGQERETRDPVWLELVEPGTQVGESRFFHRRLDEIVEKSAGIDLFLIAAEEFQHQVISIRPRILDQELPFHGQNPPFY